MGANRSTELLALKPAAEILWAEVWEGTGRGKKRFKILDLSADERCARPIPDFLRSNGVKRRGSPTTQGRRPSVRYRSGKKEEEGGIHRRTWRFPSSFYWLSSSL